MSAEEELQGRIAEAVNRTRVFRAPRQPLATFGASSLAYYLVTEPSYKDIVPTSEESVIRDGKVESLRPAIVTPSYLLNLEGFGENAREYLSELTRRLGANSPGLSYRYRNEPGGTNIVSGAVPAVAQRIADDLDQRSQGSAVVLLGVDDLWDVSLLKFIYEYTAASFGSNMRELQAHGLLEQDPGTELPRGAVQRIEELFEQVKQGMDPGVLKRELDRWGLFERYQDRFFAQFKKRS